jgi:putative ABC transport system permease protein
MGTTTEFFDRYKYRRSQGLEFAKGQRFDDLFDAVVGADVAATLGYAPGDPIVLSHGLASFSDHDDQPFRIRGVLEKTGTPLDRTVLVSLQAIQAIHVDWKSGARKPGAGTPEEVIRQMDLTPSSVTAALIGTKSKLQVFALQRWINEYPEEPLLAALPGLALQELWQIVGLAETALAAVSAMVVVTALMGMTAMLLSSLGERRRELAIWRAMGAGPATIAGLLTAEAVLMAAAGAALGLLLLYAGLLAARPAIDAAYGLWLPVSPPDLREGLVLAAIIAASALAGLIPALRAYRMSLADGMMVKM